jgi:magnesium-transporting ATPase (P-type)
MYWYNMYALFSGQTIYNDFYMSMYNVGFVCFPIIFVGFMDQVGQMQNSYPFCL